MTDDWKTQYLQSLTHRDEREQKYSKYINSYTLLADRQPTLTLSPASNPAARTAHLQLAHDALTSKHTSTQAQLESLKKQTVLLQRRLRDREEEAAEKSKLVQNAHDEMVAMNLQLSMAEQKADKLEKENKELVDRWVKRMEVEVEEMNERSRW
ncbi:autophagy protein 16 [Piedraia hortae CBS 480.64]|uniref:Autophagy protein 16 n=1 Tax=Piedraia hortae CBS 480.64 TaxID=1314780 RepID=A0A6A7C807_9PEZI|nr:autophagy protein 16 [Piedraia hortae CBS 480.64]